MQSGGVPHNNNTNGNNNSTFQYGDGHWCSTRASGTWTAQFDRFQIADVSEDRSSVIRGELPQWFDWRWFWDVFERKLGW